MSSRPVVPALVLGCLLAGAAPAAAETVPCANADRTVTTANQAESRLTLACLIDRERASRGLPRLTVESRVAAAAQGHAQDMLDRGYFSHTAPPPKPAEARDRLRAQGYEPAFYREVIGQGQTTPREVVRDWLASPSHCASMLAAGGPDPSTAGPVHLGIGSAGTGSAIRWVMVNALPEGTPDPGDPGVAPSCPAGNPAPDDAQVRPFTDHRPGAGGTPPPAGGGPQGGPPPPGASAAGLTAPRSASLSGTVFAGDALNLVVEASPDAVLRVSVTDFRGRTKDLGLARRIDGSQGGQAGTVVFALPGINVLTALDVVVTDGRTTVSKRLVPVAVLRAVRARRRAGREQVSGRLVPGLAGRRVRISLVRGKRRTTRTVRTSRHGRFAARLPIPGGAGRLVVRIVAPGDAKVYKRASASVRGR